MDPVTVLTLVIAAVAAIAAMSSAYNQYRANHPRKNRMGKLQKHQGQQFIVGHHVPMSDPAQPVLLVLVEKEKQSSHNTLTVSRVALNTSRMPGYTKEIAQAHWFPSQKKSSHGGANRRAIAVAN